MSTTTSSTRRRLIWIAAVAVGVSTAVIASTDTSASDPAPEAPTVQIGSSAAGGRLTFR